MLPDITEGAAVRLAAWLERYERAGLVDEVVRAIDCGHHGCCTGDPAGWVQQALDSLMAHLDEREVA